MGKENYEKKWKVYMHLNKINNKKYIGITSSKNPNYRWQNGKGYRDNIHFTNAIKKYGWENFDHEIIANNLTEEEAKDFEKVLIKQLNTQDPNIGYNLSAGGDGVTGMPRYGESNSFYGKHHTEESREKMRKNHYDVSGENNPNFGRHHTTEEGHKIAETESIPVCQFDLELNFIAEYPNSVEASKAIGMSSSTGIRNCCRGQSKISGGYIWIRKQDVPFINKEEYLSWVNTKKKRVRPVIQYTKNMEYVAEYESCAAARRAMGLASGNSIESVCAGRYKESCGYLWKYKYSAPTVQ